MGLLVRNSFISDLQNETIRRYNNKVVKNNISVRDLEGISSDKEIPKKVPIVRQPKVNEYHYIEEELRDILGTKVKVDNKKIEIFFDSKVDLTRILDILNVKVD